MLAIKRAAAVAPGRVEHGVRAQHVGLDGLGRPFDDELHADGGGQMDDGVGLAGQPVQDECVAEVVDGEGEIRVVRRNGSMLAKLPVLRLSSTETVSPRARSVSGEVAADETCAAGDEYVHELYPGL